MQRPANRSELLQSMLGNTAPVQPHCVSGCLHSTDPASSSIPCCITEPLDAAADGSASTPLVGPPDTSTGMRAYGRTADRAHHIAGVQLYSEVQRGGQVTASTEPPSSMKTCPSAASVLSYARSDTDSSVNGPACRICDSAGDGSNRLISPCRCSGTSKFVHEQCLNKWLETINARSAPRCEVCRYRIHTRKCYRIRNCRIPAVSSSDFTLHLIFLTAVIIILISGTFTVFGFISNHAKITSRVPRDSLSQEDIVVLVGGLTFFIAFIIALLTQIRASQSLYKLIVSCISSNTEWRIDPYRHSEDSLYHK